MQGGLTRTAQGAGTGTRISELPLALNELVSVVQREEIAHVTANEFHIVR